MESNLVALQAVGERSLAACCSTHTHTPPSRMSSIYIPIRDSSYGACEPSCVYLHMYLFAAASLRTMLGPGGRYTHAPVLVVSFLHQPLLPPVRSVKCYVSDLAEESALLSDPMEVLDAVTARISVSATAGYARSPAAACSAL